MINLGTKIRHLMYIVGREISGIINCHCRSKGEKHILLFCSFRTMEEHLVNYLEQIEGVDEYNIFLCFGDGYEEGRKHPIEKSLFQDKKVKVIYNEWSLYLKKWDLIVCADMDYPFWVKRGTIPLLYIGHGVLNVSYDNGEHAYDYGKDGVDSKGRPLFDKMLEPSRRIGEIMKNDPIFASVVQPVGYRFAYKMREAASYKEYFKKKLNIRDDSVVVSVWGSWNKESLFHVLGIELFEECKKLKKLGYDFIFSIHPREYVRYDDEIKPLGMMVEKQRENGFFVRSPNEDWLPYMMASDIIIVDYSAMLSLAVLSGKKIILSDFPETKIWKESVAYHVKRSFPTLFKAEDLPNVLNEVGEEKYQHILEKLQDELYVSPNEYCENIRKITSEMMK